MRHSVGIVQIQHRPQGAGQARVRTVSTAHDPLEVAADFVRDVTGQEPTDAESSVLRRAYEAVLAAERSA